MGTVHTIDELKALIDPLSVYQEYIRLTRRGKRAFGLCPFHKEKTPSFSVDTENGLFYCFGCHKGGDLIQFLQSVESCSFPEALEILARKTGVTLASRSAGKADAPDRKERLRKLLQSAAAYYRKALASAPESAAVRQYVARRAIRRDTEEILGLGFAPPGGGLLAHLNREGFRPEEAQEVGLVLDRGRGQWGERFHNRLIFPISDVLGRVVGFGGRALGDEEPKYLNSSESAVFQKREVLYGFHLSKGAVREREQALLVEGYMDYLAVTQAGAANAVATLGTALAEGQVRLLKRYAREVVLNFDQDRAGLAAAHRAIQALLGEGMRVRVVVVPDGKDPDEFIRKNGAQAYVELVREAQPFFEFLVERAQAGPAPKDVPAKMAFLEELAPYLAAVADPIERQEYAREVAGRLGMDPMPLLKRLAKGSVGVKEPAQEAHGPRFQVPVTEQVLVRGLLAFPEAAARQMAAVPKEALHDLSTWPLVEALLRGDAPAGPDQTALLAFIQNSCHEVVSEANFGGAVTEISASYLRRREREVQNQIREASRRNDLGLVQILYREKMALLEQIQSLDRP